MIDESIVKEKFGEDAITKVLATIETLQNKALSPNDATLNYLACKLVTERLESVMVGVWNEEHSRTLNEIANVVRLHIPELKWMVAKQ